MIKEPERDLQKLKFTPAKAAAETAEADEVGATHQTYEWE